MTSPTRRGALLGAASVAAAPGLARAQGAAPAPFHRMMVGAIEVTVVNDGTAPRPDVTGGMVANASAEDITRVLAAQGLAPTGLSNTFSPTLLRTGAEVVLIDTGRGGAVGQLAQHLRAAGVPPETVTLVVLTHFHGDHIGGLVGADGTPAFPNARVLAPARELAFWTDAGEESRAAPGRRPNFALAARNLGAYAGKVTGFARDAELAPGLRAVATNGHSPGHTSFLVHDGARQVLVMGDVVGAPELFLPMPGWHPAVDMDPAAGMATRLALLDRVATDRIPVIAYHWPMPATGRVERAGSGYRLLPPDA